MSKQANKIDQRLLQIPFACSIITRIFKSHPNVTALRNFQWVPKAGETEFWFNDGDDLFAVDTYGRSCSLLPSDDDDFPQRVITERSKELSKLMCAFEDEEPDLYATSRTTLNDEFMKNKTLIESILESLAKNWFEIQKVIGTDFSFHFSNKHPIVAIYVDDAVYYFRMQPSIRITDKMTLIIRGCEDAKHIDRIVEILA